MNVIRCACEELTCFIAHYVTVEMRKFIPVSSSEYPKIEPGSYVRSLVPSPLSGQTCIGPVSPVQRTVHANQMHG